MTEFQETLIKLIREGRENEIFSHLKNNNLSPNQIDGFTILVARLNDLNQQQILGLLNYEQIGIERNKIRNSLIYLIRQLNPKEISQKPKLQPFKIFKGKDLKAFHLLKYRALDFNNFNPNFYYHRSYLDAKILVQTSTFPSKHLIIIGKPLAGKSRAIFEMIHQFYKNKTVLLPEKLDFPKNYKFDDSEKSSFLIYDDIDTYLEFDNHSNFLEQQIQKNDKIIIATCRQNKFKSVKRIFGDKLENVVILKVKPLSKDDKYLIEKQLNKNNPVKVDDTIGSYFLPLSTMKHWYESNLNPLELEILRAYKIVHIWRRKNVGNEEVIKDYVYKRRELYHQKPKPTNFEWDKAIQNL